jgi:hypothetical protein
VLVGVTGAAQGVIHNFAATFGQECTPCPAGGSTGTGSGLFQLDTTTGMVSYNISFANLSLPPETNAHVHGPANDCGGPPPVTAGIVYGLPLGSPKVGLSPALTAAQQADMLAGRHYVNIHSQPPCGGGEIRAQIREVRACCLRDLSCQVLTQADCLSQGGVWNEPGSDCTTVNCYKNWVVADDFCINGCPQCRCDVNGDGQCNTLDVAFVGGCLGPAVPPCAAADVNCDGIIDPQDQAIVQCFVLGGVNCCPPTTQPFPIDKLRWYGSYLDPAFEPSSPPPIRPIDGWSVGFHADQPATPCPPNATIDFCGTIGGSAVCPTFTPDGAVGFYLIGTGPCCGFAPPPTPPIGSRVRVCATWNTACPPCATGALGNICVFQYLPCDTMVSRPGRLLAQWEFSDQAVVRTPTPTIGCDQHPIYCYDVNIEQGCLAHDFTQPPLGNGEVIPSPFGPPCWRFRPLPGQVYWLSIQPEVGHSPVVGPGCLCQQAVPVPGNPIRRPFWGWHTTPPGYHNKDDAFMGFLAMTCRMDWIYHWMNHLHWSDPLWVQCADDPTASMDMSFYLFNMDPNGSNRTLWCQPIEGGPPTPPPPTPPPTRRFPPAGIDTLTNTVADVAMVIYQFGPIPIQINNLQGGVIVRRDPPIIGGPTESIPIEMVALSLQGIAPLPLPPGPVVITERTDMFTPGQVTGPAGDPFVADSFFDVFFEIHLPNNPPGFQNIISNVPAHVQSQINEVPPTEANYQGNYPPGSLQLFDRSNPGLPIGELRFVSHRINDRGGIDVHSDADWPYVPQECTCLADLNFDGRINGADIQAFVDCLPTPQPTPLVCPCICADLDGNGFVETADIPSFISMLVTTVKPSCP